MKWARIENNVVMEIIDFDPVGRFHPDLIWVECPENCEQRWTYIDGQFNTPISLPPPTSPEPTPEVTTQP